MKQFAKNLSGGSKRTRKTSQKGGLINWTQMVKNKKNKNEANRSNKQTKRNLQIGKINANTLLTQHYIHGLQGINKNKKMLSSGERENSETYKETAQDNYNKWLKTNNNNRKTRKGAIKTIPGSPGQRVKVKENHMTLGVLANRATRSGVGPIKMLGNNAPSFLTNGVINQGVNNRKRLNTNVRAKFNGERKLNNYHSISLSGLT